MGEKMGLFRDEPLHVYNEGRGIESWVTFSDPDHPLKPDDSGYSVYKTACDYLNIKPTPQRQLEEARIAWGGTLADWASVCGRGRNYPPRWLKDPSTMNAEEVRRTCELFGCTLDYLRGKAQSLDGYSNSPMTKDDVAKAYSRLYPEQMQLVTNLILQFMANNEAIRSAQAEIQELHSRIQ